MKIKKLVVVFISFFVLFVVNKDIFASIKAAKALSIRGKVYIEDKSGKKVKLKVGDWVDEGDSVTTKRRSVAKLILQDKSKISVGPNSKMLIEQAAAKKTGVVSLLKGAIRSTVNKNILEAGGEKMVVKTGSAAMGVRGTDFQVTYNPVNNITNTITYSGEVKMVDTKSVNSSFKQIRRKLRSKRAISVRKGQFSTMNHKIGTNVSIATKLSPVQFNTLKNNTDFVSGAGNKHAKSTGHKRITPPGLAVKDVMIDNASIDGAVGGDVVQIVSQEVAATAKDIPPPEGFMNKETGELAPPAGGFIDLKTGVYVPPPPGSTFDSNTGVYVPPPSFGAINPTTGEYIPPENYKIDAVSGEFVVATSDGRDLATNSDGVVPPPPVTLAALAEVGAIGDAAFDGPKLTDAFLPPPSAPMEPEFDPYFLPDVDDSMDQIALPPPNNTGSATVNFTITIQ